MIDWDLIRTNYNKRHKTSYKTTRKFLQGLYNIHKSCYKIADKVFVSANAVNVTMHKLKIKLLPKGHRHPSKKLLAILAQPTEAMYIGEIVKKIGVERSYAQSLLRNNGRSCLKGHRPERA